MKTLDEKKKNIVDSKLYNIIVWVLAFGGMGIVGYSIFLQSTPYMITGFSFVIVGMVLGSLMGIREMNESRQKLKDDFDDIIELIKADKLKDAWNKTEKDISSPTLNPYLQGLIFGTQLKGEAEGLSKLQFKNKKDD